MFLDDTYKKLGYRRDSARRRSLRCPRSFKVTDFGNNRRPACDFLFMNNTNFLSRTIVQYLLNYSFWQGVPLSNEFVFRILCELNTAISSIFTVFYVIFLYILFCFCLSCLHCIVWIEINIISHAESWFFGLHFCHRHSGSNVIGPQNCWIRSNNAK